MASRRSRKKRRERRAKRKPPASPLDQLLSRTIDWVADRTPVDDATHDALELVAIDNLAKLQMFRQVLAMHRTKRIYRFDAALRTIEDKLMSPEALDQIQDPKLLVMIANLIRNLTKEDVRFLESVVDGPQVGQQGVYNALSRLRDEDRSKRLEEVRDIEPQKRDLMRAAFSKLLEEARRLNGEVESIEVVDPPKNGSGDGGSDSG